MASISGDEHFQRRQRAGRGSVGQPPQLGQQRGGRGWPARMPAASRASSSFWPRSDSSARRTRSSSPWTKATWLSAAAKPPGSVDGRLAGLRMAAMRHLPPEDLEAQGRPAAGQWRPRRRRSPHAARGQIGQGKMGPARQTPPASPAPDKTIRRCPACRPVPAPRRSLHHARQPPGAVGVEGHHVVQGVGHHGHRAQVLHGGDEPFAFGPGLVQAVLFGEEEVPQAQGGGGIVDAEPEQTRSPRWRGGGAARRRPARTARRPSAARSGRPTPPA